MGKIQTIIDNIDTWTYPKDSKTFLITGDVVKVEMINKATGIRDYSMINSYKNNQGLNQIIIAYNNNHLSNQKEMVDMGGIIEFFKDVTSDNPHVWLNDKYLGGIPCIKNKLIPVSQIIANLTDGTPIDKICQDYSVTREEIQSAVYFVLDILNRPYMQEFNDEDILG